MSGFTSFSSYDTSNLYQIKNVGLCAKCNQRMIIEINKPQKGKEGTMLMIYGKGCDDSRCGGCPIDLDTEYYYCGNCQLDFCKLHSENPNYQGPTSNEKNTQFSYTNYHNKIYMKETLEILMKRAEIEPDIKDILQIKIDNKKF